jgi:hypothetical protein
MERTAGFPIYTRFFERNIFANYLYNVQPVFNGLSVGHNRNVRLLYRYSIMEQAKTAIETTPFTKQLKKHKIGQMEANNEGV